MNNFDLAEEIAIANMMNALANPQIADELSADQKRQIREAIRDHVYKSYLKMHSPLGNNIAATPSALDRRKLTPADDAAARLWGEEPENPYTPHL